MEECEGRQRINPGIYYLPSLLVTKDEIVFVTTSMKADQTTAVHLNIGKVQRKTTEV